MEEALQVVGDGQGGEGHVFDHRAGQFDPVAFLAEHEFLQVGADGFHRVHGGVEVGAQPEQQQQGALQQHPVFRDLEDGSHLPQRDVHFPQIRQHVEFGLDIDLDLLQVPGIEAHPFQEAAVEKLDDPFRLSFLLMAGDEAHAFQGALDLLGIAAQQAFQEYRNTFFHRRGELGYCAEVEKDDPPVRAHQDVTGMGIGMVEPVAEDHLAVGGQYPLGQYLQIQPGRLQGFAVGNLDAFNEFGGQHPLRGAFADHCREAYLGITGKIGGDLLDVIRFLLKIQLGQDHLADLGEIGVETTDAQHPSHQAQQALDGGEVDAGNRLDVGILHLHRHHPPVMQAGFMHLGQGGAGDGLRFKFGEERFRAFAKLLANPGDHLLQRARRDAVLQLLQFPAKILREKIAHDADQLSRLDEQTFQHQDGFLQAPGVAAVDVRHPAADPFRPPQAAEQMEAAQAEQQAQGDPVGAQQPEAAGGGGLGRLVMIDIRHEGVSFRFRFSP